MPLHDDSNFKRIAISNTFDKQLQHILYHSVNITQYTYKIMRTTKFFTIVATLITAGFLVLATTSNAAFATGTNTNNGGTSASATSSISQSNTQSATCTAGTSNTASCNQLAANVNFGNAVSAAEASSGGTDPTWIIGSQPPSTSATASSSISQSNSQTATCTAGTSNSLSCNQLAANVNFGNAVSAAIAQF